MVGSNYIDMSKYMVGDTLFSKLKSFYNSLLSDDNVVKILYNHYFNLIHEIFLDYTRYYYPNKDNIIIDFIYLSKIIDYNIMDEDEYYKYDYILSILTRLLNIYFFGYIKHTNKDYFGFYLNFHVYEYMSGIYLLNINNFCEPNKMLYKDLIDRIYMLYNDIRDKIIIKEENNIIYIKHK